MTILSPQPTHSSREFDWNQATRTFSAEASTLRGCGHREWAVGWPKLGQVYDDACDEGFTLVSAVTDKSMTMVIDEIDHSDDYAGGWRVLTFVPADRRFRNFKLVVFND